MDKVGKDGVITVEETKTMEVALEVVVATHRCMNASC